MALAAVAAALAAGRRDVRARAAAVALGAILALTGCGSASSSPGPPQHCLDRWNDDEVARVLGEHAYDDHDVRRARVSEIAAPPEAENIRADRACLVVFAVAEGDGEEGRLGLVVTRFGWSQLFELGYDDGELLELQRSAADGANADLFPDGTLD